MVETELHRALLREDWARSQELLLEQPALAREADPVRGGRPLHVAAICGAPLSLVRRLVEADPPGLAARDCWERTPLDAAMRNQKASAAVLAYLQADPMPFVALAEARDWAQLVAKQRQQRAGAWVAALAEERGAPGRIVTELCELLGPESLPELVEAGLWEPLAARSTQLITAEVCAIHDADGRYPVEVAIQGGAPDELVQQLTSHSPQPILVHAIDAGNWARAIALASLKPDWASVKDHRRGWLPVHAAVRGGAPLALVRQLVEAFPEGLAAKDSNDRTAYEIAVRQAQRNSKSQALPLSPTRAPKAGRPSSSHSVDPALQQRQVQHAEVIGFIQHYPTLRDAAERHNWAPLVALQRETSSGGAWIASLARMHGAPPSVMDGLSECLGLQATIAAEAWSTLLRHSDQLITATSCATPSPVPAHSKKTGDANTSEQPQQEYAIIFRTLRAVKLHLWVNLLSFAVVLSIGFVSGTHCSRRYICEPHRRKFCGYFVMRRYEGSPRTSN
jgi:hypothetical protein